MAARCSGQALWSKSRPPSGKLSLRVATSDNGFASLSRRPATQVSPGRNRRSDPHACAHPMRTLTVSLRVTTQTPARNWQTKVLPVHPHQNKPGQPRPKPLASKPLRSGLYPCRFTELACSPGNPEPRIPGLGGARQPRTTHLTHQQAPQGWCSLPSILKH